MTFPGFDSRHSLCSTYSIHQQETWTTRTCILITLPDPSNLVSSANQGHFCENFFTDQGAPFGVVVGVGFPGLLGIPQALLAGVRPAEVGRRSKLRWSVAGRFAAWAMAITPSMSYFFGAYEKLTIFPNKPISRGISRQAMFDTEGYFQTSCRMSGHTSFARLIMW